MTLRINGHFMTILFCLTAGMAVQNQSPWFHPILIYAATLFGGMAIVSYAASAIQQ